MRGRSSPKQGNSTGMEVEKVDKLKQEPHLSGAYIRSLVKQLTSSRTKDPLNPKDHDDSQGDVSKLDDSLCNDDMQLSQPPPPPPQTKKKQVRRRLHTSRPYQERLLNMAEARREIVTALKFHRASMKQQQQQQPQTGQQSLQTWPQAPSEEQGGKPKSRRNPRIYASNTINNNLPSYNMENFSNSTFSCLPTYPYSSPVSSFGSQIPFQDHLNFPLPNQTLGLNLNFQDFSNLDATLYRSSSNNNNASIFSSPSPSSSSDEFHYMGLSQEGVPAQMVSPNSEDSSLHPSMDDQEMAEIRSIGEQHEMEWNDTLNLATSAWWFKFLKAMEIGPDQHGNDTAEDYGSYPFDEVMEFPDWLNATNESCLQQHVDDTYSHNFLLDPTLPCMDIEEIEGMDAEWLA